MFNYSYNPMSDPMVEFLNKKFNNIISSGYVLVPRDEVEAKKPKYVIVKETTAGGKETFFVCKNDDKQEVVKTANSIEKAREELQKLNDAIIVKKEIVE